MPGLAELEDPATRRKRVDLKTLILYNDDFNTFEFVASCLVSICGHLPLQAEQCTYLVHYTGKCAVKHGSFRELKPLCEALLEKGLSAKIES
jgi:ATP-dependent Clp protease adaptor protein ClpS